MLPTLTSSKKKKATRSVAGLQNHAVCNTLRCALRAVTRRTGARASQWDSVGSSGDVRSPLHWLTGGISPRLSVGEAVTAKSWSSSIMRHMMSQRALTLFLDFWSGPWLRLISSISLSLFKHVRSPKTSISCAGSQAKSNQRVKIRAGYLLLLIQSCWTYDTCFLFCMLPMWVLWPTSLRHPAVGMLHDSPFNSKLVLTQRLQQKKCLDSTVYHPSWMHSLILFSSKTEKKGKDLNVYTMKTMLWSACQTAVILVAVWQVWLSFMQFLRKLIDSAEQRQKVLWYRGLTKRCHKAVYMKIHQLRCARLPQMLEDSPVTDLAGREVS